MSKKSSFPPKKAVHSKSKRTSNGCVIFAGIAVVAVGIALAGLVFGLLNFFGNSQTVTELSGLEDNTSPEDVEARREQAETWLNSYGWVDKEASVVRIPIDQAMVLVAESGLPVGIEITEEPTPEDTPTPTLEIVTEVPSEGTPIVEIIPTATSVPDATSEPLSTETPTSEPLPTPTPAPTVDLANVSFQGHVLPILERSCHMCHGGEKPEGGQRIEEGLILLNYDGIIAGSWNGSVIEPGDVEDSYLIEQIATGRMPKEGDRLTSAEVEIITAWVEAGALDN